MSRGNQILAAVLVLQLVLVAVFFWPRSASVGAGEALLIGLEADQIVGVTIRDPVDGERVLAKETGKWVLPDAGGFPCKEDVVSDLLDKLVALKTDRLVTETRSSHKRLKVTIDDFLRFVEVRLADGTGHKLYLGSSPSPSVTHVRLDGQDAVYLASGLSSADVAVRTASWIDTEYLTVAQDQIVALTLENANGTFVFAKDEAGTWSMTGLAEEETLDEGSVTALVMRVSSIRMIEPLGQTDQEVYGLGDPAAVLTVQTQDADGAMRTHTLYVGAREEESDSYYLKLAENPYYVRVSSFTTRDWVEKARDGFLVLPPTPTPEPTPTPASGS